MKEVGNPTQSSTRSEDFLLSISRDALNEVLLKALLILYRSTPLIMYT